MGPNLTQHHTAVGCRVSSASLPLIPVSCRGSAAGSGGGFHPTPWSDGGVSALEFRGEAGQTDGQAEAGKCGVCSEWHDWPTVGFWGSLPFPETPSWDSESQCRLRGQPRRSESKLWCLNLYLSSGQSGPDASGDLTPLLRFRQGHLMAPGGTRCLFVPIPGDVNACHFLRITPAKLLPCKVNQLAFRARWLISNN